MNQPLLRWNNSNTEKKNKKNDEDEEKKWLVTKETQPFSVDEHCKTISNEENGWLATINFITLRFAGIVFFSLLSKPMTAEEK